MADAIRRRDFSLLAMGVGLAGVGITRAAAAEPARDDGLSFDAETIHQEILFAVPRSRVYATLTGTNQFDAVVQMSHAAKTMKLGSTPTMIDAKEGGAFVLFGGYIVGRIVELVPDTHVVQAWREVVWPAGVYSLVTFALSDAANGGTKLTLDQAGFPKGAGHALSVGWHKDYWEPMTMFLGWKD